jgi:hypothetical protein
MFHLLTLFFLLTASAEDLPLGENWQARESYKTKVKSKKLRSGPKKKANSYTFHFSVKGEEKSYVQNITEFPRYYVYQVGELFKVELLKTKKRNKKDKENAFVMQFGRDVTGFVIDEDLGGGKHKLFWFEHGKKTVKRKVIKSKTSKINYQEYFPNYTGIKQDINLAKNIDRNCKWDKSNPKLCKTSEFKTNISIPKNYKYFCYGLMPGESYEVFVFISF